MSFNFENGYNWMEGNGGGRRECYASSYLLTLTPLGLQEQGFLTARARNLTSSDPQRSIRMPQRSISLRSK